MLFFNTYNVVSLRKPSNELLDICNKQFDFKLSDKSEFANLLEFVIQSSGKTLILFSAKFLCGIFFTNNKTEVSGQFHFIANTTQVKAGFVQNLTLV